MQNIHKLLCAALALFVAAQAVAARPWLGGLLGDSSSPLEATEEQLRENQLRRLQGVMSMQLDSTERQSVSPVYGLSASPGYGLSVSPGYGLSVSPGYGLSSGLGYGAQGLNYGESLSYGEGLEGSNTRSLLAPTLLYSSEEQQVQAVVQAGAAWDPDSASIELNEAGMAANRAHQFYEESDEVMVGPVPALRQLML